MSLRRERRTTRLYRPLCPHSRHPESSAVGSEREPPCRSQLAWSVFERRSEPWQLPQRWRGRRATRSCACRSPFQLDGFWLLGWHLRTSTLFSLRSLGATLPKIVRAVRETVRGFLNGRSLLTVELLARLLDRFQLFARTRTHRDLLARHEKHLSDRNAVLE